MQEVDLSKLFGTGNGSTPMLTVRERQRASVLIVESDANTRSTMRQSLTMLDIGFITEVADHAAALRKMEERDFSHVIFEAKRTTIPARNFLISALEQNGKIVAIPSSYEPSVDDVFNLLIVGARGYLVKPFTTQSIDETLVMATKGDPVSESILYAKSRNEALAALIMTSLDKLAAIMRQSKHFETARREVPRRQMVFRRVVELGKMFAQGGEAALVQAMVDFSVDRSQGPTTRLGKLRKLLETRKHAQEGEQTEETKETSEEAHAAPEGQPGSV